MSAVLGINAVFHDPAAALVVDGIVVAAAEEERFSRRKHGKAAVAFAAWELPEQAARWCLAEGRLEPAALDAVAYSYEPALVPENGPFGTLFPGQGVDLIRSYEFEPLRTLYARLAPEFLAHALPGLAPERVRFVPHHLAHAASAYLAAPLPNSAVLVLDGRGEERSHLAGWARDGELEILAAQRLPHSLGLFYEEATAHLGFARSSDEYKVMALAAYGEARQLSRLRELVRTTGDGGFVVEPIEWSRLGPARKPGEEWSAAHADLAASVQARLEEVLLELACWLRRQTGEAALTMAGGVALNCVANSRLARESGFSSVWVQPAAGDAGTALGAALLTAAQLGDRVRPLEGVALGRGFSDEEIEAELVAARVDYERPASVAAEVAASLASDGIVGWFQGRSEYGPRALGHRSLLAHPGRAENLERLNDVKGREQFRPVAPMVLAERAAEVFDGPLPSAYMLFTHVVRPEWRAKVPAVVHVDGSARVQTVDADAEPLVHEMLERFAALSGLPVCVNTSLNTAGRPMVDSPRDVLECFGSSPIDLLAIGPFLLRRPTARPRR